MSEPDRHTRTEVRDGMRITWNQPVRMADGTVLRADIYRPVDEAVQCPVILTLGVYAKGLTYQDGYPMQWQKMVAEHPDILEGSSNKYQAWEVTDPERWVPHHYAVVRVDSRGAGWSEGRLEPMSPQEDQDICECIEWAGTQAWSSGKVAVMGISYYAVMAWRAAARQPAHLSAIVAWEGFMDLYRDSTRHGGILSEFAKRWAAIQAVTVQYGLGERAKKNANTGESIAGPVTLSDEELARNRVDLYTESVARPLDDAWWQARAADPRKITLPFLSAANWGGQGIHPRGNFLGFTDSPAPQKWLEVHGDTHWSPFSSTQGLALQKRFLDHFLKGLDNGWDREPPVLLNVRHVDGHFTPRKEAAWPIPRTTWTRYYLHDNLSLSTDMPASSASLAYEAMGPGLLFQSAPFAQPTEVTGPITARLYIASSTRDADLFLIVRVFDPAGKELTFQGALDPNTPIAQGWLRASHRRLDPERTKPWQPVHTHDREEPLTPGEMVAVDVEILPTSVVLPAGWRLALAVRGKDYEYEGDLADFGKDFYYATRGTGGMTHNEPLDRLADVFGGLVTLYTGGEHASHLVLPIIPQ